MTDSKTFDRALYYNKRELKELGWTESMVRAYLIKQDDIIIVPFGMCGRQRRYYLKSTVDQLMQQSSTVKTLSNLGSTKSKEAKARGAINKSTLKTSLPLPKDIAIQVLKENKKLIEIKEEYFSIPIDALNQLATDFLTKTNGDKAKELNRSVEFLRKYALVVNQDGVKTLKYRFRHDQLSVLINLRQLKVIAEYYPNLAEECERNAEITLKYYKKVHSRRDVVFDEAINAMQIFNTNRDERF